jgi:invasion protein IalB
MKTYRTILTAAIALASVSGALAQAPTSIGTFNSWSAWSYNGSITGGSNAGKVCYMHSVPSAKTPADLDHGDVSFSVSRSPTEGVTSQANFVTGYPFQENSTVTVDIDGRKFTMFTQGESAWLLNTAEEPQLLDAMRSGKSMTVTAKSRRGNETTYQISLAGATAASKKLAEECK